MRKKKPQSDRGHQCKRWFRLIAILLYGGRVKKIDLAAELGTSAKTIGRDVAALEAIGLPIERRRIPSELARPGVMTYRTKVDDFNEWLESICK